jgi:hypothetical protein
MALSWWRMDHRRIAGAVGLSHRARLKPCQVAAVDVPRSGFGPSRAVPAWPAVAVTEGGVPAERADARHVQRAEAIAAWRLADLAIDRQVLERLQGWCGDHTGTRRQLGIAAGLRRATMRRWGGLFHTACRSAVVGHREPGTCGTRHALFRTVVCAGPAPVEAVGVLPACGPATRSTGQEVRVAWGHHRDAGSVVEGHNIHVTRQPPGKGALMGRTLTAQMTERHAAWQHQHPTHQVTHNLLLGCRGGFHAHQYTIQSPHGSFS